MKPHEETWKAEGSSIHRPDREHPFGREMVLTAGDSRPQSLARAKLATQAPAMARALLAFIDGKLSQEEAIYLMQEAGVMGNQYEFSG